MNGSLEAGPEAAPEARAEAPARRAAAPRRSWGQAASAAGEGCRNATEGSTALALLQSIGTRTLAMLQQVAGRAAELISDDVHLSGVLYVVLLLAVLLAVPGLSVCACPWSSSQPEEEPPRRSNEVPPSALARRSSAVSSLPSCKDLAPRARAYSAQASTSALTLSPRPSCSRPASMLGLAPAGRESAGHGLTICSELVVPPDNECTLLLPLISERDGLGAVETVTVDDARGIPIFQVTVRLGPRGGRSAEKRLVLSSAVDDIVFASCRDAEPEPGARTRAGLSIFCQADAPFGVLRPDGLDDASGYSVRSRSGGVVCFRGDARTGCMKAIDEHDCIIALTEATSWQQRWIRIGPRVDAGLVILAMLGIDLLELELDREARPQQPRGSR